MAVEPAEGDKRTCYVICPIGGRGSGVRKRSDQVLKHLIAPALEPYDYDVRRADKDAEAGEIGSQIIDAMANADLVVADLSEHNPNVFYELAIRHVAAKPLVQLINVGEDIPFDISHMRTVQFNLSDPDDLEEARKSLEAHVKALQGIEEMETPVKASLGLRRALESPDPTTAGSAEILAALNELQQDVTRMRSSQAARYSVPTTSVPNTGGAVTFPAWSDDTKWIHTTAVPSGGIIADVPAGFKIIGRQFPEPDEVASDDVGGETKDVDEEEPSAAEETEETEENTE